MDDSEFGFVVEGMNSISVEVIFFVLDFCVFVDVVSVVVLVGDVVVVDFVVVFVTAVLNKFKFK